MKFGAELSAKIFEPWRNNYLRYNDLKIELKRRQVTRGWNEKDEDEFVRVVDEELAKVYRFVTQHVEQLEQRISLAEHSLERLTSSQLIQDAAYDQVADTLTEILFDMNDLAYFHQLNLTGFRKLLKKHDRYTQRDAQTRFLQQSLATWPLDNLSFNVLIVRLSRLHDICRQRGAAPRKASLDPQDETQFERATQKFWVHPDNITEVKSILLYHLPLHVYQGKKSYKAKDAAISSVYFDNSELDLYGERLERSEGAESIRCRWYGTDFSKIYVERKTHKAPWFNGHSVKERFRLDEGYVNTFTRSAYTSDHYLSDLQASGVIDNQTLEQRKFVFEGIQHSMAMRKLQPMCRVFYNRTAFQHPGDSRLRLSLDCDLTFVREDHLDGQARRPGKDNYANWCRTDVGDFPFRMVHPKDIIRFPFAVLETKIQTHLGQAMPDWLADLLSSHLVHEVPRFSKYLHGVSQFYPERLSVLPWWLAEMDKDIRKLPSMGIGLSRSASLQPLINGHHRHSLEPSESKQHVTIQLLDAPSLTTNAQTGKGQGKTKDWLRCLAFAPTDKKPTSYSLPLPPLPNQHLPTTAAAPVRSRPQTIPLKRTEPKTFFANERTFINWLQFSALLLTVALNLLNTGDHVSRLVGAIFIILSSLLSFYALGRFQFRAWQLRTGRNNFRYDDIYGPTVLCILLVTALVINFYLRAPTLIEPSSTVVASAYNGDE